MSRPVRQVGMGGVELEQQNIRSWAGQICRLPDILSMKGYVNTAANSQRNM